MKRFVIRISVFIAAMLCILKVIEMSVSHGLMYSGSYPYNDIMASYSGDMEVDIAILGSSRAFVHYDPSIIQDSTGMSCYNLSIDGGCQTMQFAIWKNLIQHNPAPRIVVQNVEYVSFGKRKTLYEKERYLPFIDQPQFYDHLILIDPTLWQDRYVPMFRYHGHWELIKDAANYYRGMDPRLPYDLNNGHRYVDSEFSGPEEINDYPLDNEDLELGKKLLLQMVSDCKTSGSHLILTYAPEFDNGKNPDNPILEEIIQLYHRVATENSHVSFWDMRDSPISSDKDFFADNYHMNEAGARIFSQEFAHRLKLFTSDL